MEESVFHPFESACIRKNPRPSAYKFFAHATSSSISSVTAPPVGVDEDAFLEKQHDVNRVVHDSVQRFGGSISAEHGLGQYKRDEIRRYKSPVEMELMRAVKGALDPLGIMNPGKVL